MIEVSILMPVCLDFVTSGYVTIGHCNSKQQPICHVVAYNNMLQLSME